jgi:hypothetical protein
MIGPGPVSPGALRNAVPLDKTQVLPFDEKSGIATLGPEADCAAEFAPFTAPQRRIPARRLLEKMRLALIDSFPFRQ